MVAWSLDLEDLLHLRKRMASLFIYLLEVTYLAWVFTFLFSDAFVWLLITKVFRTRETHLPGTLPPKKDNSPPSRSTCRKRSATSVSSREISIGNLSNYFGKYRKCTCTVPVACCSDAACGGGRASSGSRVGAASEAPTSARTRSPPRQQQSPLKLLLGQQFPCRPPHKLLG